MHAASGWDVTQLEGEDFRRVQCSEKTRGSADLALYTPSAMYSHFQGTKYCSVHKSRFSSAPCLRILLLALAIEGGDLTAGKAGFGWFTVFGNAYASKLSRPNHHLPMIVNNPIITVCAIKHYVKSINRTSLHFYSHFSRISNYT
jgi:hypothetical protein